MKVKKSCREFVVAFDMYVGERGGVLQDARDATAVALLKYDAATVIAHMCDVPHDLAAILSGVVGVRDAKLVAKPGHVAEAFLEALLETSSGQALYRQLVLLLHWAQEQNGKNGKRALAPYLYQPR